MVIENGFILKPQKQLKLEADGHFSQKTGIVTFQLIPILAFLVSIPFNDAAHFLLLDEGI